MFWEAYIPTAVVAWMVSAKLRRSARDPLAALIAALAISLGLLIAVLGILHVTAVVSIATEAGRAYDMRLAWLIATGAILVYTGAVNMALTVSIKHGKRSAMSTSAVATAALILFLLVLHPALSQTSHLIMHGGYIVLILLWFQRARRVSAA